MRKILMRYSPKKDIKVYQNNVEKSFNVTYQLIYNTRKCLEALEAIPKHENFTALGRKDVLKDEASHIEKSLLKLKDYLNDSRFQDSILELWKLNEDAIKYHHGYAIEDRDKFQFFNGLKREIDLLNEEPKKEEQETKDSLFDMSETLMFINKSMRGMRTSTENFLEELDMPKSVPFTFSKVLDKVKTDLLKKETLEEQKILFQETWKTQARKSENNKKYLKQR